MIETPAADVAATKSNHQALVIRIPQLEKHPNADSLSIVRIGGYQVVVRTEDYREGDLAVFIQPDSVVPETAQFAFLWEPRTFEGPVPTRKRRITVRKFRKEWSEGLLMPLSAFSGGLEHQDKLCYGWVKEGDDVAEALGITHYEPPESEENTTGENERGPQYRRWPRSFWGWIYFLLNLIGIDLNRGVGGLNEPAPGGVGLPIYDVEAFKNFNTVFQPGEMVIVTEKIHGSAARFVYANGKMYAGSRRLWKSPKATGTVWRKALAQLPWITEWCKENSGYTLYGEVVPTQKFKNGKPFNYGTSGDQVQFFVYDIWTPESQWINPKSINGIQAVPQLYFGPYDEAHIKQFVDGRSQVGDHIREGVVIRAFPDRQVRGLGRAQLKIVSNLYLEQSA